MVRVALLHDEDTDSEYEEEVTLADGDAWAQCVLDDMENANHHTMRSVLSPLIWLLPEVYVNLDSRLRARLQHAVDAWDNEF